MNEAQKNLRTAYEWLSRSKCCGETDESGKCSTDCSLRIHSRAILDGVHELQLMQQALESFGSEQIAAGLDARRGLISVRGWVEGTTLEAAILAKDLADLGMRT